MPFLKDRSKMILRRSQRLENLANKNGLRHAFFNAGNKYIGEWKDNKKSGNGIFLGKDKKLYEGEFLRGYRHGFGVLANELDCKVFTLSYRGEWKYGRMHGYGLRIFADGSFYLGGWKRGGRDGYGQMWYIDGSFYDGDWREDQRSGFGMLVMPDGNRYEGDWAADMKNGGGRYFHLDSGQMQRGVWSRDVCVLSKLTDIPFRQTAPAPSLSPVPPLQMVDIETMYKERERSKLAGENISCLSVITFEYQPSESGSEDIVHHCHDEAL